jgi:hypothetical protein
MPENRRPDPKPPENRGPGPRPPDSQGINLTPAEDRRPGPEPPGDDIRWLIYLATGLVAFLAIVAWSGFHNAMGH